jgi:ATP-binding cassette subfamily B protein
VIAIVGESGCGKTTLAKLIAGNLSPTSGRLAFDGFEHDLLSHYSRKQQVQMVLQENSLFSGTIKENIAFCDIAPDDDKIVQAAFSANALDFVKGLPGHFDYYLSEGGLGLSGGQKQRISIARTLYKEPKILILDEATSALDSESETSVLRNMQEVFSGKTVVIIAHRLSTIRNADRILVMDAGRIVEDGSHAVLLKNGQRYYELFKNQVEAGAA